MRDRSIAARNPSHRARTYSLLRHTVAFYKALKFAPIGEDAPGTARIAYISVANCDVHLFLQVNLINIRGARIHRLKEYMHELGIPVTLFEEFKSEERLMLDGCRIEAVGVDEAAVDR